MFLFLHHFTIAQHNIATVRKRRLMDEKFLLQNAAAFRVFVHVQKLHAEAVAHRVFLVAGGGRLDYPVYGDTAWVCVLFLIN
jgi:hypothetical protein